MAFGTKENFTKWSVPTGRRVGLMILRFIVVLLLFEGGFVYVGFTDTNGPTTNMTADRKAHV